LKISLVPIFLLLFVSSAFAHSGGTDECGGHIDRKLGGYHVHDHSKYCACYPGSNICKESDTPSMKKLSWTIAATGKLVKIFAIGGETTGWAVELESPLEINGEGLKRIEVDPKGKDIEGLEGKQVKIKGHLEKRLGIERGSYTVIVIEEIYVLERKSP
jgi:hypothetical protein